LKRIHTELHELVDHRENTPKNATVAMTTQVVESRFAARPVTCFISRERRQNSRVLAIVR